ncbi:MFS transporter [Opitutaceae bacterium EW11]|nr:MFS transporter [Opitutaceae bacterium EW11]
MDPKRAYSLLLIVIYLGYISLGLPDGTFGVAWPQMYRSLQLPIGLAGTIMVVGTLLAAVSGFSSGRVVARFKTGPVVLTSCVMTGSGLLILGNAQNLAWLCAAAVPLGFGAGAVDAALNGYVARHYTGRHMNWLHACWGIGATCGPLAMAYALGTRFGWRGGYYLLSSTQLSLAVVFLLTLGLWKAVPERTPEQHAAHVGGVVPTTPANSAAGWLSVATFAIYVAVEATMGLWASSIMVVSRGIPKETAGFCTASYYASITLGRILVGIVVDRWGNRRLIALGSAVAVLGALLFATVGTTPFLAALSLVLLGLGFAPVYPCSMHEVPRRFAPEAVQVVIGRQSGAANLGGAFLPAAAGALAGWSLEAIAWTVLGGIGLLIAAIRRLNRLT